MEMVAEFPPAVNVTSASAEDAVRGTVSNSSSSRLSSEIETLQHCRAGGGPIELPEANVRGFEIIAVKSEPAAGIEKEKELLIYLVTCRIDSTQTVKIGSYQWPFQ